MKKILFLTRMNGHGGSLKMLTWLANAMSKYYDVYYCNLGNNKPFYELDSKVTYLSLNCIKENASFFRRNIIELFSSARALKKIQKQYKFDAVVNFGDHSFYSLVLLKLLCKIKVIVSQRVDPYANTQKKSMLKLYNLCDGLVCQTDSALEYFSKTKINGIVIHNPYIKSTTKMWNINNNDGYILSLGRMEIKQKRQDVLVKATSILKKKYKDIKVLLYGKNFNNTANVINEMIKQYELTDNVFYKGITDDPINTLLRARMLVLTSDYEGIPNVILEAMSIGLPVVSTDCRPGGARLLLAENNGKIVPCGDFEALADAIDFYLTNPEESIKIGLNGFNSLDRFSEDVIEKKWVDFINSIIQK